MKHKVFRLRSWIQKARDERRNRVMMFCRKVPTSGGEKH